MKNEQIQEIIGRLNKENNDLETLRTALNDIYKLRASMSFDHPWLPAVNQTISNSQYLLKIKIDEESNTIPNLILRSLITETLKFMVPFLLGVAFAVYGIPDKDSQDAQPSILGQSSANPSVEKHPHPK